MLGIGSGSTIVHAVQQIGMFLGCLLHVLCGMMGAGRSKGEEVGHRCGPALLGSSSVELGKGCLGS